MHTDILQAFRFQVHPYRYQIPTVTSRAISPRFCVSFPCWRVQQTWTLVNPVNSTTRTWLSETRSPAHKHVFPWRAACCSVTARQRRSGAPAQLHAICLQQSQVEAYTPASQAFNLNIPRPASKIATIPHAPASLRLGPQYELNTVCVTDVLRHCGWVV